MNLIVGNIPKSDDILIINFNPWASQTPQSLITDFFAQVSDTIKPYNKSFSKLAVHYAKKLIDSSDEGLTSKLFGSISGHEQSLQQISDEIDRSLKKLNKKLIITIDDIDRLNYIEISEVFKLVRNTANFHNTVFILLYDRNYVASAIGALNDANSDLFLEKIIQLEISLPICDSKIIKTMLKNGLKERFMGLDDQVIERATSGAISFTHNYVEDWITNVRDVNRLLNSLQLNYSDLGNEVDFRDFFKLEILRLKLPNIYNLIKQSSHIYLKSVDISDKRYVLEFKKEDEKGDQFLISKKAKELYNDDTGRIDAFLGDLFIDKHRTKTFGSLSVLYPSNFNRYFRYSVSDNELSEIEFSNARRAGLEEMKSKIDVWVEKSLVEQVLRKFKEIHLYDSEDDRNLIINSIFYFANKPRKGLFGRSLIIGYDDYDLRHKLRLYSKTDKDKYRTDFISIVNEVNKVFSQELVFLHSLIEDSSDDCIISKVDLQKLLIEKLTLLSAFVDKVGDEFWALYRLIKIKIWQDEGGGVKRSAVVSIPELQLVFRKVVERIHIDEILQNLIDYNHRSEDERYKLVNINLINEIWGTKEEFYKYLTEVTHENAKYLEEFIRFYNKFDEVEFKTYIDFPLTVIPK